MQGFRQNALTASWLLATLSLVITLYLGEVRELPVCHLCWYQRICLYPQVIILALAVFKNDYSIRASVLSLSAIGWVFASYQYLMQQFPLTFDGIQLCGAGPSCAAIHMSWLGFITLPLLSVGVFTMLFALQLFAKKPSK